MSTVRSFSRGHAWLRTLVLLLALLVPGAHAEVHAEESVRVGGQAALTRRDVLEENRLPAGRYLLAVTLSGRSNWDRHVLYFEVKD